MCVVSVLCMCVINEAAQIKSSVRRTKSRFKGAEMIKKKLIMFLNKFNPMLANVLFVKSWGWKNNWCNQFHLLLMETSMQNEKVVSFPEWRSAGVMDLELCISTVPSLVIPLWLFMMSSIDLNRKHQMGKILTGVCWCYYRDVYWVVLKR